MPNLFALQKLSWDDLAQELLDELHRGCSAPPQDSQKLVHELRVHQIELEMQNHSLREAQSLIEESRARYAELYDQAPVGYATLDLTGIIVEINLTGAALLHRDRNAVVGLPFVALGVRDSSAFFAHLRTCRENGRRTTADVAIQTTGKEPLLLRLTTAPRVSGDNRVLGFRTMMSDLAEERGFEAESPQLESATMRSSRAPLPLASMRPIAGIKVLFVDDQPDMRELAALTLGALGAIVQTADSAAEALELVPIFEPEIIVSDVGMPDHDGNELMRRVRRMPGHFSSVPAIALTAYVRGEDVDRTRQSGFDQHLAKPVSAESLAEAIAALVPEKAAKAFQRRTAAGE